MRRFFCLLLLCTTGCVEFVALSPEPPGFTGIIEVVDSADLRIRVRGQALAGVDEDGRPYTFAAPWLRVGDHELPPATSSPTSMIFDTTFTGAAAAGLLGTLLGGTVLRPPGLVGVEPPLLPLALPRRLAPPSAVWQDGTLRLLTGYDDDLPAGPQAQWFLHLTDGTQLLMNLSRQGGIPAVLELPAYLIGACGEGVQARLDTQRDRVEVIGTAGYRARASVIILLYWDVPCA